MYSVVISGTGRAVVVPAVQTDASRVIAVCESELGARAIATAHDARIVHRRNWATVIVCFSIVCLVSGALLP